MLRCRISTQNRNEAPIGNLTTVATARIDADGFIEANRSSVCTIAQEGLRSGSLLSAMLSEV
jgi:hypothetical protein